MCFTTDVCEKNPAVSGSLKRVTVPPSHPIQCCKSEETVGSSFKNCMGGSGERELGR